MVKIHAVVHFVPVHIRLFLQFVVSFKFAVVTRCLSKATLLEQNLGTKEEHVLGPT